MQTIKLGKDGPDVSAMGLGCMGMSISYGVPDDDDFQIQGSDAYHRPNRRMGIDGDSDGCIGISCHGFQITGRRFAAPTAQPCTTGSFAGSSRSFGRPRNNSSTHTWASLRAT